MPRIPSARTTSCAFRDPSIWTDKTRELNDHDLLQITHRITDPTTLRNLASQLQIPQYTVESELTNNRNNINIAAHYVLKNWSDNQSNKRSAFETMCSALENIGKSAIIKDTLL